MLLSVHTSYILYTCIGAWLSISVMSPLDFSLRASVLQSCLIIHSKSVPSLNNPPFALVKTQNKILAK